MGTFFREETKTPQRAIGEGQCRIRIAKCRALLPKQTSSLNEETLHRGGKLRVSHSVRRLFPLHLQPPHPPTLLLFAPFLPPRLFREYDILVRDVRRPVAYVAPPGRTLPKRSRDHSRWRQRVKHKTEKIRHGGRRSKAAE